METKIGNFFEEHVEKMVLVVVVLVCLWLLVTRVILSPNEVEYGGQKFGSGEIDIYISKQAEILEDKLNRKPEPKQAYESQFDAFFAKFNSAIGNIDTEVYLLQPILSSRDVASEGIYNIPEVGEVNDVEVEHIRAVAYVPLVEVDEENPYSEEGSEASDLDFITVEAKFDVAQLCDGFNECFASEDIKEEWRDPCLAIPVFAAVELQRRERLAEDTWSEWKTIPRTKIDPRKKLFEVIEEVSELPAGGMKVRLLQFDVPEVRMDLLQPEAYMIASAREEWFPPSLHREFAKQQREEAAQERRDAREAEKAERDEERERLREERISRRTTRTTPTSSGTGGGGGYDSMMMDMMMGGGPTPSSTTRRSRSERTRTRTRGERGGGRESDRERSSETRDSRQKEKDIYDEFDAILIGKDSNFTKMREPLVFWAYDDTVEPGKSYQYRIQLGIFNPIAGTDQFSEEDKSFEDRVILWSKFSDVTESVTIPEKLYFFPLDVQEAVNTVNTVKVAVARYMLGYWYREEFMVERGEVIGKVVKTEIEEKTEGEDDATEEGVTIPETIDYSTGAVLVDVRGPVTDWLGGKNMRPRQYYDMLYSYDGANIEHTPIESRYWAKDVLVKFNEIGKSEKETKVALRPWGSRAGRRGRISRPGGPAGPGGQDSADEYMRMMQEMMMQGMR
jgi:hypothetical protein